MSLNLHALVRPIITTINADTPATLQRSAGYDTRPDGSRRPKYLAAQNVLIQVQPLNSGDIKHAEFLNIQGELRVVFGYGSTEGIVRASHKGGDLLTFPPYPGEPILTWMTSQTIEVWASGWSKIFVALQTDRTAF